MSNVSVPAEYDAEKQEVYLTLSDGKDVTLKCPKTRQVLQSRKLFKSYEADDLDEEELAAVALVCTCVIKYGDKKSLSINEALDLDLFDFRLLNEGLEFFRSRLDNSSRNNS